MVGDRDTRSLLTDAMEACVGQAFRRVVSFPVSASDIRRWAIAVYHPELPPRRYWDEQYCIESAWGGLIAPEDFNPFAWATASPPLDAGVRAERPWPEP